MKLLAMKWNDLIEIIMLENKGIASIQYLYSMASKYKELPANDWKKTLRGVLYRDAKKGRFIKVGLALFALKGFEEGDSAFNAASKGKSPSAYLKNSKDSHTAIEAMLIELGNFFEYISYTGDPNKIYNKKILGSMCGIKKYLILLIRI